MLTLVEPENLKRFPGDSWSATVEARFVVSLAELGSIAAACKSAHTTPRSVAKRRKLSPSFDRMIRWFLAVRGRGSLESRGGRPFHLPWADAIEVVAKDRFRSVAVFGAPAWFGIRDDQLAVNWYLRVMHLVFGFVLLIPSGFDQGTFWDMIARMEEQLGRLPPLAWVDYTREGFVLRYTD